MTIRIPANGPVPTLMDIDVQKLIEAASAELLEQLSENVDAGRSPAGEALPPVKASTARVKQYLGPGPRGHRTGASKRRWRRRMIKRGRYAGNTVVELAPIGDYRGQLGLILGGAPYTPGSQVMTEVNRAVEQTLAKALELRQADGSLKPAK